MSFTFDVCELTMDFGPGCDRLSRNSGTDIKFQLRQSEYLFAVFLLASARAVYGQPGKCNQTRPEFTISTPSDIQHPPLYTLEISNKGDNKLKFLPGQTYVLTLEAKVRNRPFKKFMITVEDPEVDNNINFDHRKVDVGNLKTLDEDRKSRYSERCYSSVENNDNSDKNKIEMHWVSPKDSEKNQTIRFRAMVAENNEVWYEGEPLTVLLQKDDAAPVDRQPYEPVQECNLASEARYEVIFNGKWSKGTHSLHFPSKPYDIMYSFMIGASHDFNYTLWEKGADATPAFRALAEDADISLLERDIILNMSLTSGTRTLIRGKMHKHPYMHEPSHALFRVDRYHHLFSIAVAMKPSPDWFLGTTRFELCSNDGWLDSFVLKLYPWDAGTMDGISYDSPRSMTQPPDKIDRVAVGSFDRNSPFYQMNLNDLKPFALLEVRRLEVYPVQETQSEEDDEEMQEGEEEMEEPLAAESRMTCSPEWSQWSPCSPHDGVCGLGSQTRSRSQHNHNYYNIDDPDDMQVRPLEHCQLEYQTQACFINCFD